MKTASKQGPALTRLAAARAADGELLALLDDDDEWLPTKTQAQVNFVEQNGLMGSDFIVSCRFEVRSSNGAGRRIVAPRVLYQPGMEISEYIFHRPNPMQRANLVGSGTPLFPRSVVERVPFKKNPLHDDLAWILDCVAGARIPLFMIDEVGYVYYTSPTSRNQTGNWRDSVLLARNYKAGGCMTGRALAGLLSTTTAWRAKRRGGMRAVIEIARIIRQEGEPTLSHWISLGIVACLPLDLIDHVRRVRR